MPIQRIPKYLLLLKDILKALSKDTDEFLNVNKGLANIEEFLLENDLNLESDSF